MSGTSPVTFFVPDTPQFSRTLRQRLIDEHDKWSADIIGGIAGDFADYRYRCGFVAALTLAIKLCAEIEQDMRN